MAKVLYLDIESGRHSYWGEKRNQLFWYCLGCKRFHHVPANSKISRPEHNWKWNGSYDKPTVTPSVHEFMGAMPAEPPILNADGTVRFPGYGARPQKTICHIHITKGQVNFLNDCVHDLRGLIDMVDIHWKQPE